jgi:hypothetical protein
MTDDAPIEPQTIATEFLDQWDRAHQASAPSGEMYRALGEKFALYTGQVSCAEADAVRRALHAGRIARGWPEPDPKLLQVTIEAGIFVLWLGALRSLARREHGDAQ